MGNPRPPVDDAASGGTEAPAANHITTLPPREPEHHITKLPPREPEHVADPLATDSGYRMLVLLTTYLTLVVVGFYLFYTNNYGGWTSGPRWVFWLTPFWLLTMLPAVDRLAAHRGGRILALVCLAVSVLSASYPAWNPWRHPWIFQVMEAYGWIAY